MEKIKRRKGKKEKSNVFVRVRKEGEKTTMTTKIFSSDKKFPEEYEVTITVVVGRSCFIRRPSK
jgi:hypothetical protein